MATVCNKCRNRRRKCPHKRAMLPPKVDDAGAGQRQTVDPPLIPLIVSPGGARRSPVHSGGNKRRRAAGGRVRSRKGRKRGGVGIQGGEDKKDGEIYGTIAVKAPPEILELYKSWQRQGPSPEPLDVDKNGHNEETENKNYAKASDAPVVQEAESAEELILNGEYIDGVTKHVVGEVLPHVGVEGDLMGELAGHEVAEVKEREDYAQSLDEEEEEIIQQAIARAIDARNISQLLMGVEEIEETIADPEHPGELQEAEEGEEGGEGGEGGEEGEIYQQLHHQDPLVLDQGAKAYQPIHPELLYSDEAELELEQLYMPPKHSRKLLGVPISALESKSLVPSIGPASQSTSRSPTQSPKLGSDRAGQLSRPPAFPPTPTSTSLANPTPPPPPSSTHRSSSISSIGVGSMSLAPVTGPERWKRPFARQSRFSGPKIYTPLTLHPPSRGLGVVDYARTPLPQWGEGDQRRERPRRQMSEEL